MLWRVELCCCCYCYWTANRRTWRAAVVIVCVVMVRFRRGVSDQFYKAGEDRENEKRALTADDCRRFREYF